MQVFNVKVYNLFDLRNFGKLVYLGNIFIKRNVFGVRELITNFPIKKVSCCTQFIEKSDLEKLNKFGYALAVQKEELIGENLVSYRDIVDYIDNFDKYRICYILKEMKVLPEERQELQDLKNKVISLSANM